MRENWPRDLSSPTQDLSSFLKRAPIVCSAKRPQWGGNRGVQWSCGILVNHLDGCDRQRQTLNMCSVSGVLSSKNLSLRTVSLVPVYWFQYVKETQSDIWRALESQTCFGVVILLVHTWWHAVHAHQRNRLDVGLRRVSGAQKPIWNHEHHHLVLARRAIPEFVALQQGSRHVGVTNEGDCGWSLEDWGRGTNLQDKPIAIPHLAMGLRTPHREIPALVNL